MQPLQPSVESLELVLEKHEDRELLVVLLLDICNIKHTSMKQDCFSVLISGLGFVSFLKDLCSTLLLTNQPIFGDFTRLSKYMTLGYPDLQHPAGRQYSTKFMVNLEGKPWKYRKKYPFLFVDHIFHLLSWQQAIRALVHSQGRDLLLRAFGAAIDMIRALYSGWVFAPCSDCLKKGTFEPVLQYPKHPEIFEKKNVPITATLRYAETPCSFSESWFHAPSDAVGRTRPAMAYWKKSNEVSTALCSCKVYVFHITLHASKEDNCQHDFWGLPQARGISETKHTKFGVGALNILQSFHLLAK